MWLHFLASDRFSYVDFVVMGLAFVFLYHGHMVAALIIVFVGGLMSSILNTMFAWDNSFLRDL